MNFPGTLNTDGCNCLNRNKIREKAGIENISESQKHWFVMRDLKRANAKLPAYKLFVNKCFEVFTPLKWSVRLIQGKRVREEIPVIQDLFFVHAERQAVDVIIDDVPTVQYRYKKGGAYCEPLTVRDKDMERFIHAVKSTDNPRYYLPSELTPNMCGRMAHIVGGMLDGYEGKILSIRGTKKKILLVELPGFFSLGVEVDADYIRLL